MPAGRQGISKAGRSTQGKVRGLRVGASFPQDIMAARRDRVARAQQSLGKGSNMASLEITYTRQVSYSMELNDRKKRELADHLDITVRALNKLVADGELCDEHEEGLLTWMGSNLDLEHLEAQEEIDLDQITAG